MASTEPLIQNRIPLWVVLVCLATLVFGIAGHELWTPDEPREAEMAREMALGNSWLVPRLAGAPFVEKPPLYYWVSALMMLSLGKVVGATVAARATSALCAALTLLVVWLVARRYLSRFRAVAAILILTTTYGFFYVGHWILMDSLLMFLTCAAVFFLFDGLERRKLPPLLGGYLSAGLAFLTKGFVAWAVLAVPWGLLLLLYFKEIVRRPLRHLAGIIALIGPGAVWAAAFYSQGGPQLWKEWFVDNQIGRFLGRSGGHYHGFFYYLGLAPLVLLPWSPAILSWLAGRRWRKSRETSPGGSNLLKVAAAWSFGGLLFLSLAGTKRDIYLFPILPGFAVLISEYVDNPPAWVRGLLGALCVLLLLPMALLSLIAPDWLEKGLSLKWDLNLPVLFCTLAGVFSFIRLRKNFLGRAAVTTALFYLSVIFGVFPILDRHKNYGPPTRRLAGAIPPEMRSRVCGWELGETTSAVFSYYAGLTLVDIRDKMRLAGIINGEDSRFSLFITRDNHFPLPGTRLPPWEIVAREKMGVNRVIMLIGGKDKIRNLP